MAYQPGKGGATPDDDPYSNIGNPDDGKGSDRRPASPAPLPSPTKPASQPGPVQQPYEQREGYSQGIPVQKQFVDETAGTSTGKQGRQQDQQKGAKKVRKSKRMLIFLLAIIIVVGAVIAMVKTGGSGATSSSTQYTTINQNFQSISSCRNISSPGSYYLSGKVSGTPGNGTCINIYSDNVKLVCNGNGIYGPGGIYLSGHTSYGIGVHNASNVSIEECSISNFTYGIASFDSQGVQVSKDNMTGNYEPVYFSGTAASSVSDNYISGSTSPTGMVRLDSNSTGNLISNNTLTDSEYYGFWINSTGNTFANNYVSKNLYSFACGIRAGYPKSNIAYGNVCYNNSGCGFVTCTGVNIPNNVSLTVLNSSVTTCGSILAPGDYDLTGDINAGDYLGSYNSSLYKVPCIRIDSNNVKLDCNGHSISGAEYAVASSGTSNDVVANCTFANSEYGVYLSNTTSFNVSRTALHGDTYGIRVNSSRLAYVDGISADNNTFAVYLSGVNSSSVSGFDLRNNTFGAYFSNSTNNLLYSGKAFNNTNFDVYATNDSAGQRANLADSVSCGFTDALWAPCNAHISPNLQYYPLTTCYTIVKPGNYSLVDNIVGSGPNCINIKSDNVRLSCGGHSITAASGVTGTMIGINGKSNVSISGCGIYGYGTAIYVSNSSGIQLTSIRTSSSADGISLSRVSGSIVTGSNITSTSVAGILADRVSNSTISDNRVSYSKPGNVALLVSNSTGNRILNNSDQFGTVGLEVSGGSLNNTVVNNTMQSDSKYDYECSGAATYIGSNNATYNYGVTSSNCDWLAALDRVSPQADCEPVFSSGITVLKSDYVYNYGATCYAIKANNFTLDCGGHVIISTSGGTFATFDNVIGGTLENCKLKGFGSAVLADNSTVRIVNSTIYGTGLSSGYGINVSGGEHSNVSKDAVYNSRYGIAVSGENYSIIRRNSVNFTDTAYLLGFVSASEIENNLASYHNLIGAVIGNSTSDIFSNNLFNGTEHNVVCDPSTSQCP